MPRRRLSSAVLLFAASLPLFSQEAIFVVRHAEKQTESNDAPTPLSEAGAARARRLAEILKDAGVTAIFSTDTVRTRSTVEPLARMRRIPVQIYPARDARGALDPGSLVRTLRERHSKDVVLVVGHGDTVGPLLAALGCPGEVRLGAAEYDNLFVVVPRPGRPPELLRLRY
jgi:broad specificity phosphatase PhoE